MHVLRPDGPERIIVGAVPGTWQDLEAGAPEVARMGAARLQAAHVALLGTLRRDRSPRISPVEPYIVAGHLLVGAMTWSRKAADLQRDPRYVLHSAVTSPDSGDGELKVYGSVAEADQDLRFAAAGAWWAAWPVAKAVVFSLRIEQAAFIEWDIEHGWMTTHRWSLPGGYSKARRAYP
jgi:Pyridoxamine 5'-phosphate oxidase